MNDLNWGVGTFLLLLGVVFLIEASIQMVEWWRKAKARKRAKEFQ